ncbi:MAG: quinol:electron acceptor oxidoreductase subunit ActD [bacterium]
MKVHSVLGLYPDAQRLMDAIPHVKASTAARLESYTPYPVHGIDKALGLRKSPLAGMVLIMGIIGAISALGFEMWASGVDYPIVTAGKPVLSWEAFVPIMFEVTVLFATFTAGLGMLLLLNRLPFFRHPMLKSKSMARVTRDQFALAVEADGGELDIEAISAAFQKTGALEVEVIEAPEPPGPLSPNFAFRAILAVGIACLGAGYLTYWGVKLFPVTVPMAHMLDQPRLNPQSESAFFKDGSGMRLPVAGTVARGHLPYLLTEQESAALVNPLPVNREVLNQGREGFNTYCSVCHGLLGDGVPTLTAAYGAKPANLVSEQIRAYPDGLIYHAIVKGKNAMPSYSAELTEDERWAVVHYVRVLQRALNAKDEDLPKEAR